MRNLSLLLFFFVLGLVVHAQEIPEYAFAIQIRTTSGNSSSFGKIAKVLLSNDYLLDLAGDNYIQTKRREHEFQLKTRVAFDRTTLFLTFVIEEELVTGYAHFEVATKEHYVAQYNRNSGYRKYHDAVFEELDRIVKMIFPEAELEYLTKE